MKQLFFTVKFLVLVHYFSYQQQLSLCLFNEILSFSTNSLGFSSTSFLSFSRLQYLSLSFWIVNQRCCSIIYAHAHKQILCPLSLPLSTHMLFFLSNIPPFYRLIIPPPKKNPNQLLFLTSGTILYTRFFVVSSLDIRVAVKCIFIDFFYYKCDHRCKQNEY